MILTIPYPNIDPVFLRIGPVQLRWYGLMYMVSFIIGFFVLRRFAKYRKMSLSTDDLYDLLFYLILGVMVGGRLGYVIFYDLGSYLRDPLSIFAIWQGGMSFHGGFIGVHPSQLYEALLEGLLLFFILKWIYKKNFYRGTVFWALLAFYGLFRFLIEFVREPDAQIGLDLGPFTRGQELTFPMLIIGAAMMIIYARRRPPEPAHPKRKSRAP